MGPDDQEEQGPGDDFEDEGPASAWLPPDDRLWRHPSEVAGGAGPTTGPGPQQGRRRAGPYASPLLVGLASGLAGALLAVGVLVGSGVVDGGAPVATPVRTQATVNSTRPASAQGLTALVDMVAPSVVGLDVTGAQGQAVGSGVILSSSGTNCYVVTDGALFAEAGPNSQVVVSDYWGGSAPGRLVGTDPSAGIAVVRYGRAPCASNTATPGTVASVQTGEPVVAVGSSSVAVPNNVAPFTSGYISDTAAYLAPVNGATNAMYSMLVANLDMGQTGAGEPVVDGTGAVLGIANPVADPSSQPGLTYVTPIDTVMADLSSMMKTGQPAAHPWLGVTQADDVSGPGAQRLGVRGAVQVEGVAGGSPAAKAGLVTSDVVTAIAGQSISSVGALIAWLSSARVGQVCTLVWLHNGRTRRAVVTLGQQPASVNS
jgi:putative serine protease PepD